VASEIVVWGNDVTVIKQACGSAKINCPFRHPLDLSSLCRDPFFLSGQPSLETALGLMGTEFKGVQHGALPAARNTARLHGVILRRFSETPFLNVVRSESKRIEPQLSPFATKLALVTQSLLVSPSPSGGRGRMTKDSGVTKDEKGVAGCGDAEIRSSIISPDDLPTPEQDFEGSHGE
jgi:hypothetical protein